MHRFVMVINYVKIDLFNDEATHIIDEYLTSREVFRYVCALFFGTDRFSDLCLWTTCSAN